MTRVLLRAHKSPFAVASAAKTLTRNLIGNNVGNLVFSQATYRLLSTAGTRIDARRLTGLDPGWVNERYDRVVVPLADAFRRSFVDELRELTRLIDRLTIPVTVLGVGCQGPLSGRIAPSALDSEVTAFMEAVLARSATVGVRGEITAAYLRRLGFGADVVDVIGCPSMFLGGPALGLKETGELTPGSRISLNVSPYVPRMAAVALDHAARYPGLTYTAQDHLTLGLMLRGHYDATTPGPAGAPTTLDHPLLRDRRTVFPLDPATWLRHLAGQEFSFGSRIHGNIVALLAGTPAVVLAHDARTLELADYHEIPRLELREGTPVDAMALRAGADFGPTVAGHPKRWARLLAFLDRQGVPHVYRPGESPAAFDSRLAAVRYPPLVRVGDRIPPWSA
ncbi:MAG: polysaccharide pyruvyl transferase family protein [Propionibacteriaceae bacterium]|nr:polysaccharide pyruvyl transferase family protein [Propionibacteriaceae bacterium]